MATCSSIAESHSGKGSVEVIDRISSIVRVKFVVLFLVATKCVLLVRLGKRLRDPKKAAAKFCAGNEKLPESTSNLPVGRSAV